MAGIGSIIILLEKSHVPESQSLSTRLLESENRSARCPISHEDGSPHVWRNIHQSQEHLSDEELVSASCIVTSDFAVVSNGPDSVSAEVLAERDAGEGAYGVVGAVVYAIHGDDFDGLPVHIGDTSSAEAARESCSG